MKYRKFGSTGLEVSALGFGAMRLPTRRGSMLSRVKKEEAISIIRSAIDQGVNYFDTAYLYHLGASEKVLGEALRDGYREKVIIADKLFLPLIRKPEDFDKQLAKQLERLQTDHIDVYLFHGLNRKRIETEQSVLPHGLVNGKIAIFACSDSNYGSFYLNQGDLAASHRMKHWGACQFIST